MVKYQLEARLKFLLSDLFHHGLHRVRFDTSDRTCVCFICVRDNDGAGVGLMLIEGCIDTFLLVSLLMLTCMIWNKLA